MRLTQAFAGGRVKEENNGKTGVTNRRLAPCRSGARADALTVSAIGIAPQPLTEEQETLFGFAVWA